jgi:hypothetical protein
MKRAALAMAGLIALAVAAAAIWIGPRNVIGFVRYGARQEGNLHVGDVAPDVALVATDGATPIKLLERVHDRPLVVVFGSFT